MLLGLLRQTAPMQQSRFNVEEETVVRAIRSPLEVFQGYSGRTIAQTDLDEAHVLRVVYEEGQVITVVTLYPGRRRRYEN